MPAKRNAGQGGKKRKQTNTGRGYLRCHICGGKLRDHPIGRCPKADTYDPAAFLGPKTTRGRRSDSDKQATTGR